MGKSNIFSLELLYKKQLEGSWSTMNDVFVFQGPSNIPNNTGFIGGGQNASQNPAPYVSSTQKIDFANDSATAVTKGSLNTAVRDSGGGSSTTHGYWAGGIDSSNNNVSTLSRIDYANDTAVASPKGEGPARSQTAGCSNDTHGYWLGGSPSYPRIFRTTWANDTAAQVSPGANNPRSYSWYAAAAAGNQDFAWSDGGGGPYSGDLAKLDYANDTQNMATSMQLNFVGGQGYKHVAVGNASYGYWSSGENHDITRNSRICRVDWANDTGQAVIKGNLSVVRAYAMGSSSPSQGYWIGGTNSVTLNGNGVTYVERIDFANDTTTSMKGPLNSNQSDGNGGQVGARSNALSPAGSTAPAVLQGDYYRPVGADFGYITAGSANPPNYSVVDRIDYANDTAVAATRSPTIQSARGVSSLSSQNHGYTIGGGTGSASIVSRLDFTSDILAQAPKASYQYTTGSAAAATGNESFGYISGGGYPYRTSIDRLDYSNDLTSMFLKGNLGTVRARHAAAGNSSFGYYAAGGAPSPRLSSVERIDYSNDTATASPKGPLNIENQYLGATGNATYGYFGGGYFTSKVDRIEYASDTATASPKGPLIYSFYSSATGNSSYGYWTQGSSGSKTAIGRLEYASDTTTASPKGPLSLSRFDTGALSSRINGFSSTASNALPIDKSATGVEVFGPAFGYGSGGHAPVISTTSRIDYANDTNVAASKGPLDSARKFVAATSSKDFGYVAGGAADPASSVFTTIERLDYSNDSSTMVVRGDLSEMRQKNQATGNADFGYFVGGSGNNNSPTFSSTVQRLNYANDSVGTTQRAAIFRPKQLGGATSSPAFAYFSGGRDYSSGSTTITSRIDYSNDGAGGLQKGGLPTQTIQLGATGNKNFGYYGGGATPAAPSGVSITNRLDYSNDTSVLSPKGNLTGSKLNLKATSSQSFGYFSGGGTGGTYLSLVDRLDYSSDTTAMAPKGPLAAATAYQGTYSSRSDTEPTGLTARVKYLGSKTTTPTPEQSTLPFGYVAGGSNPNQKTDIGRIDFSSDTETMITKGNQVHGVNHVNSTGNTDFGYTGGGYNIPSGAGTSNIQRTDYSNDEATTLDKGDLSAVRFGLYAAGNINFGYFAGGREPSAPGHTTVFRSTYASDTAVTSPKGPLTTIRTHGIGSLGNANFGYFGGAGVFTPWMTSIDRVDYANDTADASPKGNFSTPKSNFAATGNADFGYFGGGRSSSPTAISTVDRVDYSNDTVTASPKGPLTGNKYDISGTGNSNFGYYFGAHAGTMSRTDRVEYANDTVTASIKANMIGDRDASTAYSAQENNLPGQAAIGYPLPFPVPVPLPTPGPAMGYATGSGTYVQRIDYTNDTATAPARGPLSAVASYHSAVSSKTHGYTFGGPPGPGNSLIQRIDYSNDTATAPTVANLAQPVYRTYSGMGNKTYGYQSGGQRPSTTGTSNIDRIEYANDTATGLQKGNLASSRYLQTATGNLSYGYVCGGSPPHQNNSLVQRVDYGNDTATASPKGPLHQGSRKLSSAGNADYGYVAGGTNPELSSTTRIDYGNDTATSVQKGSMTRTRRNFGGMSSPAYAYYTAGAMPYPTPALTSTDRLDYANDTTTASPKGPLSAGMSYFSAASPQDIGGALS